MQLEIIVIRFNWTTRESGIMQFKFNPMNENNAQTIANWGYEGIYSFYDMSQDIEDMEELLNPRSWADKYFTVINEQDELVGFFCDEPYASSSSQTASNRVLSS